VLDIQALGEVYIQALVAEEAEAEAEAEEEEEEEEEEEVLQV
jgi:hypothetical protein